MRFYKIVILIGMALLLVACSGNKIEKAKRAEIMQLVDDATGLVDEIGKWPAMEQFEIQGSPWFYGETYIFAFNGLGQIVIDSAVPDISAFNTAVHPLNQYIGTYIAPILEFFQDPDRDTGWFSYLWPKPGNDRVMYEKIVYVRKMRLKDSNPRGLFIASGYYK